MQHIHVYRTTKRKRTIQKETVSSCVCQPGSCLVQQIFMFKTKFKVNRMGCVSNKKNLKSRDEIANPEVNCVLRKVKKQKLYLDSGFREV